MQFLPFFSLSAYKNGDIIAETRGFFAERWGFFPRPPTSLPSPACGGSKARGDAVFARLLLSLRARRARAPPEQWLSAGCNDKKIGHPPLSLAEK